MNWKTVLTSVLTIIIALAVWELVVKNMVIQSGYEGYFEGDSFDYKEYKIAS